MRVAATSVLVFLVLIWSAVALVGGVISYPFRKFAEQLEQGSVGGPNDFSVIAQRLDRSDVAALSSRDMVRSAVAIRLAYIDAALKSMDMKLSVDAMERARTALDNGLYFFPTDGDFWLRRALVEQALRGSADVVGKMMALSAKVAPRERWILLQRIVIALKLAESHNPTASAVLRQDIETLVRSGDGADVGRTYAKADAASQAIFREYLATLPQDRRDDLEQILKK